MNAEDEHPKPEKPEKFTRAGRWKVPGVNPNPPDLPTAPLITPVASPPSAESDPPGGFTQALQRPAPPPAAASQPPAAPPAQLGPSEFTRMFQSPAQPAPPVLPPKPVPPPRMEAQPPRPATPVPASQPPAATPQQGPGEFTRLFKAPPVPPGTP